MIVSQQPNPARVLRLTLCAFAAAFLVAAFCAPDRAELLPGFARICTLPAQLTKDYFKPTLGSVSGTMLNGALIGAIGCALTFLPDASVNGVTVLAWFLTVGFCGYGMNPLNMMPSMLGVFVWSRVHKVPFAKNIHFALFSTALAPLMTQLLFYYPVADAAPRLTVPGVLLTLGVGVVVGCAMPELCAHAPALHKGYNLYNAGPAAGLLCFLLYAMLYRTRGLEAPAVGADLGEGHRAFVNAFCIAVFGLCVAAGLILNRGLGDYPALLRDPGYKSDFTQKYSAGACLMNLGVYGLFILLYYNLIGAAFTGPTMGAVFCMVCCACAGATPRNVLPVMLGYGAMGLLNKLGWTAFAIDAQGLVIGLCYASGLAPIAGTFGPVAGVVAGILHYCLVTSVPLVHGGFCLYNGGFTAGLVCFVLVPVLEKVKNGSKVR